MGKSPSALRADLLSRNIFPLFPTRLPQVAFFSIFPDFFHLAAAASRFKIFIFFPTCDSRKSNFENKNKMYQNLVETLLRAAARLKPLRRCAPREEGEGR